MSLALTGAAKGVYDDTLGAAFIGFAVSCSVYGVLSTQVYRYYNRYRNDRAMYKFLAAALWIAATIDQALIGHVCYHYAVSEYGNPFSLLGNATWTLMISVLSGSIIGTTVKTAFAIRVWRFSGQNYILAGFLLCLTYAQLGFAITYTVKGQVSSMFRLADLPNLPKLKTIASLSLGTGLLTDIVTAGALCYYLQKMRTGIPSSDTLVRSLTRYAVNCGILTSAFSLATLITYDVLPGTFVFMSFFFVLSKLYAVSFLATLNTRTLVRGRGTDNEDPGHPSNTFILHGSTALRVHSQRPKSGEELQMKIDVQRETQTVVSELSPHSPYAQEW
ncbi:hypothetical protein FIBSPDRAFT_1043069 [Athelia psychrophila]|uniref:DUF6534 domain-containing protein n=1 Tax=Athelia psychrophila TaxID=1759441 RepID=A0A166LWE6_9AGAM|nr:hypothetical protein FIBSPDRAFT_1043069 [Fibularhizoctonia sp. CBS 109695]